MMKEREEFNNYIEAFKDLPIDKKKEMTIEEIKQILGTISKMKTDLNLDEEILYNKAVLNVNSGSSTEDEFVDAVFVYLHSIEESLSEYFEGIVDNFYEEKEE